MDNLIFLIEGGRPLELVKQFIAEKERVQQENIRICEELGVTNAYFDRMTGVVLGVAFPDRKDRDGWKKPDRKGVSFPKVGSEWGKRLKSQVGHPHQSVVIAEELKIPTSIDYRAEGDEVSGWRMIGHPLFACGFLWASKDGPYGLWIPDVPAEVAKSKADGFIVAEPANSFKPEIPGCRLILEEEWNLMVAEQELKRKKQELLAAA